MKMKNHYYTLTAIAALFLRMAALLAARTLAEKGKPDAAKAALQWVAEDASDEGYQAIARLRARLKHA